MSKEYVAESTIKGNFEHPAAEKQITLTHQSAFQLKICAQFCSNGFEF
jgi:hypothetical protein